MKNIKRLLTFAVCFALIAGAMIILPSNVYAAGGYTYSVTVNAGKEGTLANGDTDTIKTYRNIENGGHVTITEESLGLRVNDDSTYYVRGLKISGHDNDETSTRHYQFPVTVNNITEDISFSVAYGVKGDMIEYIVRYVDANNTDLDLVTPRTYYGTPGDYLIVSAEYMDGYLPDAYSKGWTLREDGIREIIFYMSASDNTNAGDNGGNNANNNGGANNAGANNAGAANAGTANGQPANFVNLDDGQTPTTAPDGTGDNGNGNGGDNGNGTDNGGNTTDIADPQTPTTLIDRVGLMPFILGGGLIAALIALIAFLRARGGDGDDEDADELEEMLNDEETRDRISKADPEKFKSTDPDELTEAFKDAGRKE